MDFSLSVRSEYLNINEWVSQKSPCVEQVFHRLGDTPKEEVAPAWKNSTVILKIPELVISGIYSL